MMRLGTVGFVGSLMLVTVGCGGSSTSSPDDGNNSMAGSGGTATGGSETGGDSSSGGAATGGGAASGGSASTDDCADNPCQHGGKCTDGDNDFTCKCPAGYDGKTCDNDIDECVGEPCKNGGVCTDAVNHFTCYCADGYGGKTCEDAVSCAANPCKNGGACTDGVDGYACKCPEPFSGENCDVFTMPITQDMMVGTAYTSCSKVPPEYSGGACGSGESPGFTWTDSTGVAPSSISIQVAPAWNCNALQDTPRAVYLNGVQVGTILPQADTTCSCEYVVVPRTVDFTTTAPFVANGENTVTFAFASADDCESYGANPDWGNAYGIITLTTP